MLDEIDAKTLAEALEHATKCTALIESIVTDDEKLNDTYDRLELAEFEMWKMLQEYNDDKTKDWDTTAGDY